MTSNSDQMERFTFQIRPKKMRKLERLAEKNEVSVAQLIRKGVDLVLENEI